MPGPVSAILRGLGGLEDSERARAAHVDRWRRKVGMVDYVGEERSPTFDLSSINTVPIDLGAGAIGKRER